jgi:tetratricopeptide (TPR) repeat protein
MTNSLDKPNGQPSSRGDWGEGARLLEQAVRAGLNDPQVLYLLALAHKHQGRFGEARQALNKIAEPDAAVLLQRGLLSFKDKDYAKAAEEFQAAWDKAPTSYPAAFNVFLTRMYTGQLDVCRDVLLRILPIAPPSEQRFLSLLRALLITIVPGGQAPSTEALEAPVLLGQMTPEEEARLLDVFAGLGKFEVAYQLLSKLMQARPQSAPAFAVYFGAVLVQAKLFMERNQWDDARLLLAPLRRRIDQHHFAVDPFFLMALYQMLGVCFCMAQEFEQGINWFRQVQEIYHREWGNASEERRRRFFSAQGVPQAAWIEQNLALAHEWLGKQEQADLHWNRYIDLLEQNLNQSRPSDYLAILAFECLSRQADAAVKKEQWQAAVSYLQRAHRFRPTDYETLERLFNLYTQLRRPDEARKILRRMREVRPNDPHVELFELDVREVRSLQEVDRILAELRRIQQKYPSDTRVEERLRLTLFNLLPVLERYADQFTAQVNKVVDQMRRLPSYQVNWPVVRDVMRDMEEQFSTLRGVSQRMSTLSNEELRRDLYRLIQHCDRKIEQCRTLSR